MDNHVHLLIHEGELPLDQIMKKIEVKFVAWYHEKYDSCGYFFKDRYYSEPVDNEKYLLTVFRYILQNPMKAGLEKEPGTYEWSSYKQYIQESGFVDRDCIMAYFTDVESMIHFLNERKPAICLEYNGWKITDEQALVILQEVSGCVNSSEFLKLDLETRTGFAEELLALGMNVAQLSRVSGLSKYHARELKKELERKVA